mgnify:CR=1 FL=1
MEFLYARGLTPIEHAMPKEPLEIYREREYICSVMPDCKVWYKQRSEDQTAVQRFINDNYENYILCERLPRLPFESVSEYAKFYEAGNSVLAAKVMPNDKIEYVTWEYGYNHESVMWGHYFGENFAAAKQDFAVRAGLIDKQKLFTDEQLAILHGACLYRCMNDMDISYEDEKELHKMLEQIEELSPSVVVNLDPALEAKNELSQEVDL